MDKGKIMSLSGDVLGKYFNSSLVEGEFNYSSDLEAKHVDVPHDLYPIYEGYSLMDALCYIFDDDYNSIADIMQSYANNDEHAVELLEELESGISSGEICLTCVKESFKLITYFN